MQVLSRVPWYYSFTPTLPTLFGLAVALLFLGVGYPVLLFFAWRPHLLLPTFALHDNLGLDT